MNVELLGGDVQPRIYDVLSKSSDGNAKENELKGVRHALESLPS